MFAELLVFVFAMLAVLALVGGALWRATGARDAAGDDRGDSRPADDPR